MTIDCRPRRRRHLRWLSALLTGLALLIPAAEARASSAHASKTGPRGDAFYQPPKKLPKGHGRLIWKRGAGKYVRLGGARYTKKVLYTSKSPQRERIAVSGSISVPRGKPPKHGWPVISYAHGTTGVADACAPSRASRKDPALAYIDYVDPILSKWLRAGYAVLRTDYPGLGTPGPHPYLIGKSEARGVLDIVRAARDLDNRIGKRFLIAGHSQGGQAALFSGHYAEGWTPELKLRGTVSYAPASHLFEQVGFLPSLTSPSGLSALATMIVYGATTANPGVTAEQTLKPEPFALYPMLERKCLPQLGKPKLYGGIAPADLLQDGQPGPDLTRVLKKMNPAVTSRAPIFLAQGDADTTVYPFLTDQLDGELRGDGNRVRYVTYPGVTHSGVVDAAEADVLPWMQRRLPAG